LSVLSDDAVVNRRRMTRALGSDEQKCLATDGHGAHTSLGEVVAGLKVNNGG
jgi:hypothetical protein